MTVEKKIKDIEYEISNLKEQNDGLDVMKELPLFLCGGYWGTKAEENIPFLDNGRSVVFFTNSAKEIIKDNIAKINRLIAREEFLFFYDFFIRVLRTKSSNKISKNDIDKYVEESNIALPEKLEAEELAEYFLEMQNNPSFEIFETICFNNPRYKDIYMDILEGSNGEAFINLVKKYYSYHFQKKS